MSTPSPKLTALRIFGEDSWDWVRNKLAVLQFDFARGRDAVDAATLIEASHGDKDRFDDLVRLAEVKSMPYELHQEWLRVEMRYDTNTGYDWFVNVIREIAPVAIERDLHPRTSHYALLIDQFGTVRPETITVLPLLSGRVHLCTLAERPENHQQADSILPGRVSEYLIPMLNALPDEQA